jgi:hypothetical protein
MNKAERERLVARFSWTPEQVAVVPEPPKKEPKK